MKFIGDLTKEQEDHVDNCNSHLKDPQRLRALQETGLLDTPREEEFDRLCRLAARILNVPLTIVSLVDDKRQFFKADYGLPHPFSETRTLPIDFSLCRYTMAGDPIISVDASKDSFLKCHPSTIPWGIGSLIVLPLITQEGHVLGTFCCIQPTPREWTELDMEVMKELTASIMTEINLRNKIRQMSVEQMMRDTFVAAITHDLRTPLTVTKLTVEMMLRKYKENPDIQKRGEKILECTNRSEGMIQNLLDVSTIKKGSGLKIKRQACHLNELIENVLKEFSDIFGKRFVYSQLEPITLQADATALRRIMENLISNAAKYGCAEKNIEISADLKDQHIEICVRNYGNPISDKDKELIFLPFHRTIGASDGDHRGWGLGLALVKGLVEAHQGQIGLSSSLEEGTCFRVLLPK